MNVMNNKFWQEKWQVLKFNLVGLLNTAIDFGIFTLLTGWGVSVLYAQPAGYGMGLLNSYIWNKRWTFRQEAFEGYADASTAQRTGQQRGAIVRFIVVNAITFGLNSLVLWVCYDLAGIHEWISKGIATLITLAANYLGYSRWVFRNS